MIVAASQPGSATQDEALSVLCRSYWLPVYAYIRRRGHKPEDAQDLTQEFFARLDAKEWPARVDPRSSRFRSFLLTAVSRFLSNEYDTVTAAKRGGGTPPLNLERAEEQCAGEWSAPQTPEHAYDRRWALSVMDQVLHRLREEAIHNENLAHSDAFSPFRSRESTTGENCSVAAKLYLPVGAVGVAVLRLRRRYREVVRAVIIDTVSQHEDTDDDFRYLINVLRS